MSLYGDKIFTRRLVLRKIQEVDIPLIVNWSQSKIACGEFLNPGNHDMEQMCQQVRSGVFWSEGEKMFLVELKENSRPIGTAHYWRSPGRRNTVSMALKVAIPEERGNGYGTEIQKFLIMYIFEQLGVEAVEMHTDVNNTPQQRCLQKLGFELIESLVYDDQQEKRTGHLFRLIAEQYHSHPIYQFHYE
jgi:RimJ/RimL family protein N-acetyltransferase